MKTLKTLIAAAALSAAMSAQAHLIDLGSFLIGSPIGNPSAEATWIENELSLVSGSLTYLNKYDTEAPSWENDGAISDANLSDNGFGNVPNGQIGWNLTGLGYEMAYVLVKAANNYQLYGVSDDQVVTSGGLDPIWSPFIPANGPNGGTRQQGISHVTLFGVTATSRVPDAGTSVLLLGAGLLGIGALRRRLAK